MTMQRLKWILGWTAVWCVFAGPGADAHANGKMLLARCEQAERLLNEQRIEDPVDASFCLGYVGAIRGAMQVLNSALEPRQRSCMPKDGIEVGRAIQIVLKFLRDNPQRLAENEASLAIAALRNTYPCR